MRIIFSADDVKIDVAKNSEGKLSPTLAAAKNGSVLIELAKTELQGMLIAFAQAAAAEQGAKVESADLSLLSAGDRAVTASLKIRAKKSFIPAVITVEGRADVDEKLSVLLSGLKCVGEGMVGGLVAGLLGGKLKQFEGKSFEMAPPALKNLRLNALKVEPTDASLVISAKFES